MADYKVCLTLTPKELEFFTRRSLEKKRTLWGHVNAELNKSFENVPEVEAEKVVAGNKKRTVKHVAFPKRTWCKIVYLANLLDITPGKLVHQLVISPHLPTLIEEISSKPKNTKPPEVV